MDIVQRISEELAEQEAFRLDAAQSRGMFEAAPNIVYMGDSEYYEILRLTRSEDPLCKRVEKVCDLKIIHVRQRVWLHVAHVGGVQ